MNIEIGNILIGALTLTVGFLTYRVSALSRRESKPHIDVEWKIPIVCQLEIVKEKRNDLAYFVEAIFTNKGGKPVSAIEILPPDGGFVHLLKLKKNQKIEEIQYEPEPEFYISSKPIQTFASAESVLEIKKERKINNIRKVVPLSITVEPGHSSRFSIAFYFKDYKSPCSPSLNPVVALLVRFNNGQSSQINLAIEGKLSADN